MPDLRRDVSQPSLSGDVAACQTPSSASSSLPSPIRSAGRPSVQLRRQTGTPYIPQALSLSSILKGARQSRIVRSHPTAVQSTERCTFRLPRPRNWGLTGRDSFTYVQRVVALRPLDQLICVSFMKLTWSPLLWSTHWVDFTNHFLRQKEDLEDSFLPLSLVELLFRKIFPFC